MSAFVLHDMLEHVQAHATYRFVLSDEEDEKPRLLVGSYFGRSLQRTYLLRHRFGCSSLGCAYRICFQHQPYFQRAARLMLLRCCIRFWVRRRPHLT